MTEASQERRRWAGVITLAVAASLACAMLGWWQWERHQSRAARVAVVEANWEAEAVALSEIVPPGAHEPLPTAQEWRTVTVEGTWEPGSAVLLRHRPVDGQNAMHALAVLRTQEPGDGRLIVVNRGWIAAGQEDTPEAADVLALPAGDVRLSVRLRPAEPAQDRVAPAGQAYRINPEELISVVGLESGGAEVITGAYGSMVAIDPAQDSRLESPGEPSRSLGSHLSYALQWWFFALGAPVGVVVLARRERPLPGEPPSSVAAVPARPTRRHRPSMADEEDAELDAWEAKHAQARATSSA